MVDFHDDFNFPHTSVALVCWSLCVFIPLIFKVVCFTAALQNNVSDTSCLQNQSHSNRSPGSHPSLYPEWCPGGDPPRGATDEEDASHLSENDCHCDPVEERGKPHSSPNAAGEWSCCMRENCINSSCVVWKKSSTSYRAVTRTHSRPVMFTITSLSVQTM